MKAHTREQLAHPSNGGTYGYLLSHYGPLLTLKHLADVLHSTPNGVRMTLARRRQPLSMALSESRRRLGRRVYFDAFKVAQAIDAEAGDVGREEGPWSPVAEDPDAAISTTWEGRRR